MRLPWTVAWAVAALLSSGLPAAAYPSPSSAWTFSSDCSGHRHFVYDFVGLLDGTQGAYVEARACDLYREDGAHLVLAIVPDLGGESIDAYALQVVREWGIGDRERLDGLLILYAVDDGAGSGQGAVRVEVGYGLEGVVNSLAAREATEAMEALKASDLANGSAERHATAHALAAGASGLALFTQQNYEGTAQDVGSPDDGGFGIPWWGWVVLVALVVLVGLSGAGRRGRGSAGSGFLTGLLLGGLLRRGGGGRRRGGGGFGGGKSGGGGWGGRL